MSDGGKLSAHEVRKVAKLARLALTDAQVEKYAGQMTQALGYIERLRELRLDDVQPLTNPSDSVNCLAEDTPSAEAVWARPRPITSPIAHRLASAAPARR